MNQFKKTTKNREKLRGIYFQVGLIIAGGLTLVAFEWTSPNSTIIPPDYPFEPEEFTELPPITYQENPIKPKVKIEITPVNNSIDFEVVDDNVTIDEPTDDVIKEPLDFDEDIWKTPVVKTVAPPKEFTIVENMPEYIGGNKARVQFLRDNLVYPKIDKETNIQGTVHLNFLVNKKGEIKRVKILRGVSPTIDKEAIRVVKAMPKWKPGKQRGKAVNVSYNFRIKFKLN